MTKTERDVAARMAEACRSTGGWFSACAGGWVDADNRPLRERKPTRDQMRARLAGLAELCKVLDKEMEA